MSRTTARPFAETRFPVFVQSQQGRVAKDGDTLRVEADDAPPRLVRLDDVSELVLMGNVAVTTPCLHALFRRGVAVTWCGADGWPLGRCFGFTPAAVAVRQAQYAAAADPVRALAIARLLVAAKIRNGRTLLRRHGTGRFGLGAVLDILSRSEQDAMAASGLDALLGVEGAAAARHFAALARRLASGPGSGALTAGFTARRRRLPTDPVNAVLSFTYALLVRVCERAAAEAGFDPALGFLHQPRDGRPALALDLMEPWRPVVADSVTLRLFRHGELTTEDFAAADGAVLLDDGGRRRVIAAFEARLDDEAGSAGTLRTAISADAACLARYVTGGADAFTPWLWR